MDDLSPSRSPLSFNFAEADHAEPTSPKDFTIGWICALDKELNASRLMLDKEYCGVRGHDGDPNHYTWGQICGHNVVLTYLPEAGNNSASAATSHMRRTCSELRAIFMIGIAGGVPEDGLELGDVAVSHPDYTYGGVVQYDLGKQSEGGFELKGYLSAPPQELQYVNRSIYQKQERLEFDLGQSIEAVLKNLDRKIYQMFTRPPARHSVSSTHAQTSNSRQKPEVFLGLIASGNRVVKSADKRDEFPKRLVHGNQSTPRILCYEMEGAGVMGAAGGLGLVIRGISDYCDDKKDDRWHNYASIAAATYAKEVLREWQLRRGSSGKFFFLYRPGLGSYKSCLTYQQDLGFGQIFVFAHKWLGSLTLAWYTPQLKQCSHLLASTRRSLDIPRPVSSGVPSSSGSVPLSSTPESPSRECGLEARARASSSIEPAQPPPKFEFAFASSKKNATPPEPALMSMHWNKEDSGFKGHGIFMRPLRSPFLESLLLPSSSNRTDEQVLSLFVPFIAVNEADTEKLRKSFNKMEGVEKKHNDHKLSGGISIVPSQLQSQGHLPIKVNLTFSFLSRTSHSPSLAEKLSHAPFAVICFNAQSNSAKDLPAACKELCQALGAINGWNGIIIMIGLIHTNFGRPKKDSAVEGMLPSIRYYVKAAQQCGAAMYIDMASGNGDAQKNFLALLVGYATVIALRGSS